MHFLLMETQSKLSLKIKKLYTEPISDTDATDAAGGLIAFFKILADISKEQKQIKGVV